MGIPATGNQAVWPAIVILSFADDKIVEIWWAYGAQRMIEQITAEPTIEEDFSKVFFMFDFATCFLKRWH